LFSFVPWNTFASGTLRYFEEVRQTLAGHVHRVGGTAAATRMAELTIRYRDSWVWRSHRELITLWLNSGVPLKVAQT
jgi:hypothetical protein